MLLFVALELKWVKVSDIRETSTFLIAVMPIMFIPAAVGIAIGTASHAVGTAKAMEMGAVEGAMSSLSIVVSGILTVAGASIFALFL